MTDAINPVLESAISSCQASVNTNILKLLKKRKKNRFAEVSNRTTMMSGFEPEIEIKHLLRMHNEKRWANVRGGMIFINSTDYGTWH